MFSGFVAIQWQSFPLTLIFLYDYGPWTWLNCVTVVPPGDPGVWAVRRVQPAGDQVPGHQRCQQAYGLDTQGGRQALHTRVRHILVTGMQPSYSSLPYLVTDRW